MKALQLQAAGKLALIETARPAIKEDELLVRTGAALICTSDINDVRENPFGIQLPAVIGHEGAGTVAEVGGKVNGFRVSDRIAAHPVHPCGRCDNCRSGMGHLCSAMGHFGITMPGTFAEYFVVRADRARTIPRTVSFPLAALAEPVCVCLEALDQARLPANGTLLILGDGPFGILIARLARALPLAKVVVLGHHDFRLGFAANAERINAKKMADPIGAARAETAGRGYDAAILGVGSARAVRDGSALLRPKGRFVVFSAIPGDTPVDLFNVHVKELEIVGACNDNDRFSEAVSKLADPALRLGEFITHRFPLVAYKDAFALAERGREEAIKVAFTFEE